MSEPERYTAHDEYIDASAHGEYVRYEEYEQIRTEKMRLAEMLGATVIRAEAAERARDEARRERDQWKDEYDECKQYVQEVIGMLEAAPDDFTPQHMHFVVAPDGIVCSLHRGEYTPDAWDKAWNAPPGSYKSIAGYVITKRQLDELRHRAERAEAVMEAARKWYDVQDEIAEGREPMSAFRRCELALVAAVRALADAEGGA